MIFQNYHKHTYYSNIKVSDSATSYEDYCKRAVELGHGIISSVEHGWQGRYIECHQLAEKYGLKFLFGTEAYWVKDRFALDENGHKDGKNCHICLLAMNENGRQAINDILSQVAEERLKAYYRQSRIDLPLILSLPADDVIVTSACFLKGNQVLTESGYVNIENIKAGDKVVNRYGQLEAVNFPTAIDYNGKGYEIRSNAFPHKITCTEDHKFLTLTRKEIQKNKEPYWLDAQTIIKRQSLSNHSRNFLLYPINKSFNGNNIILKSDFDGSYKKIEAPWSVKQKLPDKITITPELMRFFGFFIGDGYISINAHNNRIGITTHLDEFECYYNSFIHPVEEQLEIKFNIIINKSAHKAEICSGCVDLINLIHYLFGNCKALTKHIPQRLLHISYELDCELLYGLILSDGNISATKRDGYISHKMTYVTISEQLHNDIRHLCCDLGIYSTVYIRQEYTDAKNVFHQCSYNVSFSSKRLCNIAKLSNASHFDIVNTIQTLYDDNFRNPRMKHNGQEFLLMKITDYNEIDIDEKVYCLNNNTHSFVCEFAVVHNCIAGWGYEDSDDIFLQLKEHFGNNFYLEVQYHNTEPQKRLNKHILKLKKQYGFQIIMGCDSHYIDEKGALDRDEYIKSKGMEYPDEEGWYMDYPDGETAYKRFVEQCVLEHKDIVEAMENTNRFLEVEEYDCPIFNHDIKMPTLYPDLTQQERDDKLEELIWDKWSEYKKEVPTERHSEYEEQIRYELDIIKTTFHSDYFLLDYAITQLGKKKGGQLTLTGRGSGVSFFLNKLLGFTSVDRISAKVKMYPERFMSPTRILETHSLADIDMNVAKQEPFWEAQEELLGYEHSKQMIAFQQLKPSAAWKMYAKSQNIDFETANQVSDQIKKYIKAVAQADEDEKDDIDVLDYIDEEYKDIYLKSTDYLGVVSAVTPHACASLVYEGNIRKEIGYIFVKSASNEGRVCCCMDGKWAEKYGFLKNDWLKVNVVEVIYKIFERIGIEPFSSTELIEKCENDEATWSLYKKQCTDGLNQVEQPSSSTKVGAYAPTNISELTAFVAAVRPGFKSMYDVFESREHFEYNIPAFDKLLQTEEMPNSFVLYQEQAMLTLNYAGIPMSECYAVIKAISKKRVEEITKNKDIFLQGFSQKIADQSCCSSEIIMDTALRVWQIIEDGSRYSFNCSHAYSVALDSLYEAWLKAHYPLEFYETYLNILNEKGDKDRLNKFKEEAEHYFGIVFPPYKFRQDNRTITIDKEHNAINNALSSIKGYSNQIAEELYQCGLKCKSFIHVLKYLDDRSIKSAKLIPLIKIGYFSEFGNENALLKFVDYWDILKQGMAKQLSKDKTDDLLNSLLPYYATDKNKDGSEAKSWKLITAQMYDFLKDIYKECLEEEPPTYKDKMQWQQEILGYIELTTGKKEDTKKILILDVKPLIGQYSPDPWCYKVETRSIGTGRTASLNIDARTWQNCGPVASMDIINVGRVGKNKKGYWYLYDYEKEWA